MIEREREFVFGRARILTIARHLRETKTKKLKLSQLRGSGHIVRIPFRVFRIAKQQIESEKTLFWLVKWSLIGDISVLLLLLLETFWLVCLCAITIVCVYIMSRITVEWFIRHNKTPQRNVTFWFVNENIIHNPFQGKWLEAKMLLT